MSKKAGDEPDGLAAALSTFFVPFNALEFTQAIQAAYRLPCSRRVSVALEHLCTCESLYLSMERFGSAHAQAALERRIDATARELEACLSLTLTSVSSWSRWGPSVSPQLTRFQPNANAQSSPTASASSSQHQLPQVPASVPWCPPLPWTCHAEAIGAIFRAIVTCQRPALPPSLFLGAAAATNAPTQTSCSDAVSASFAQLSSKETPEAASFSALTAAQRGALSDSIELLRLRRAMLPIYAELLGSPLARGASREPASEGRRAERLADRVHDLRVSCVSTLGAPLLSGVRELTLIELGTLEPLLRAHALLPDVQLRDVLLALALAQQELHKLDTLTDLDGSRTKTTGASAEPLMRLSPLGRRGLGGFLPFVSSQPGTHQGPHGQAAPMPPPSREKPLHLFLRALAARLAEKAALYLHRSLTIYAPPSVVVLGCGPALPSLPTPTCQTPGGSVAVSSIANSTASTAPPTPSTLSGAGAFGRGALSLNPFAFASSTYAPVATEASQVAPAANDGSGAADPAGTSGAAPAVLPVEPVMCELAHDYAATMSTLVTKHGAVLAALVARPDGLYLKNTEGCQQAAASSGVGHSGGGAGTHTTQGQSTRTFSPYAHTYSTRAEESGGSPPVRHSAPHGTGSGASWPALFLSPPSAANTLGALWPTIRQLMDERQALLKPQLAHPLHVQSRPVAELSGAEHSFWLLQTDARILVVVAFPGTRRVADGPVAALLQDLADGLCPHRLVEGALHSHLRGAASAPWWRWLFDPASRSISR